MGFCARSRLVRSILRQVRERRRRVPWWRVSHSVHLRRHRPRRRLLYVNHCAVCAVHIRARMGMHLKLHLRHQDGMGTRTVGRCRPHPHPRLHV